MSEQNEKGRFGLNEAEYADLMNGIRAGLVIIGAVIITLLLVAFLADKFQS